MTELALFISTFTVVFALGFQSLNVNGGHYWWAFFTSFAISASNLVLFKLAPNADLLECIAYMGGGPFGIVASMWAHRRWISVRRELDLLTVLGDKRRHDELVIRWNPAMTPTQADAVVEAIKTQAPAIRRALNTQ